MLRPVCVADCGLSCESWFSDWELESELETATASGWAVAAQSLERSALPAVINPWTLRSLSRFAQTDTRRRARAKAEAEPADADASSTWCACLKLQLKSRSERSRTDPVDLSATGSRRYLTHDYNVCKFRCVSLGLSCVHCPLSAVHSLLSTPYCPLSAIYSAFLPFCFHLAANLYEKLFGLCDSTARKMKLNWPWLCSAAPLHLLLQLHSCTVGKESGPRSVAYADVWGHHLGPHAW